MINRVGKMCVAAMSLCMIVLIVTRKRGDGRYYFALWQTNNNTPNKLLLSESAQTTKGSTWTPLRTCGLAINYNTIHNINVNKGVLTDSKFYINLI
jgi:hypothetical protein